MSFRQRGVALDVVTNSFGGRSPASSWQEVALASGDASSAWAWIEADDAFGGCQVLLADLLEEEAAAEIVAFLSFCSVAAEARITDCTSGRMWSSTLLNI